MNKQQHQTPTKRQDKKQHNMGLLEEMVTPNPVLRNAKSIFKRKIPYLMTTDRFFHHPQRIFLGKSRIIIPPLRIVIVISIRPSGPYL